MSHNPYATQPPRQRHYSGSNLKCVCPAAPRRGPHAIPHQHGCPGRYWGRPPFGGCRCEDCTTGSRTMWREAKAHGPLKRCYCKAPRERRYQQHEHGCWGRYISTRDHCRCPRCRRGYTRYRRDLLRRDVARPDWVVVDRLTHGIRVKSRRCERVEAVLRLHGQGYSQREIADRVGIVPRNVDRIIDEYVRARARLEVAA